MGWVGAEPLANWIAKISVSIPERVWGGLEPESAAEAKCPWNSKVSIPERVWGGLELGIENIKSAFASFQSLRGFGVGWSRAHHR